MIRQKFRTNFDVALAYANDHIDLSEATYLLPNTVWSPEFGDTSRKILWYDFAREIMRRSGLESSDVYNKVGLSCCASQFIGEEECWYITTHAAYKKHMWPGFFIGCARTESENGTSIWFESFLIDEVVRALKFVTQRARVTGHLTESLLYGQCHAWGSWPRLVRE